MGMALKYLKVTDVFPSPELNSGNIYGYIQLRLTDGDGKDYTAYLPLNQLLQNLSDTALASLRIRLTREMKLRAKKVEQIE